MPPRPHRPDALAWQVFRGSAAIRQGLITEHQLRSSAWLRLRHDVYADARLDRDHSLACRAALLRLPSGVLIAGPSAAYLHGVDHAATFTDDVHVLLPPQVRSGAQRGLRLHIGGDAPPALAGGPPALAGGPPTVVGASQAPEPGSALGAPERSGRPGQSGQSARSGLFAQPRLFARSERSERSAQPRLFAQSGQSGQSARSGLFAQSGRATVTIDRPTGALPRTSPGQAAWETAVWLEPVRAVGIVDTLLAGGLTDPGELTAIADANAGRPGAQRARWVFGLADGGAQSPPESHLRVRLVLAGLPRPVAQHPVRLPSGLILHPDLAWPQLRVAIEYDGHWHADPERLHTDRKRLNQLVAAGWLVLHVTSRRMHNDFAGVLREVRAALAARGWRR
ncbi:DUF559 domain-containing protein [Micromonospora sp. WP24]|uniref:endonuclease domain-containing protein n=1 Tax=Micromonospora sp. WP24 TaxID=2604469 RepID=UPI0011DB36BD|nr:DUF559 domain-containing protein [Micromonospora sp. WP24]TYC01029.1 DUF559 domain-containing protein [Micromonospora sp. WP24]